MVTSVIDPNNQTTSTSYSDRYFWRPASTTDALGHVTNYKYYPTLGTVGQTESVMNWSGSTTDSLVTPDTYGRTWLQQKRQAPGSTSCDTVEYYYNPSGQVQWISRPFGFTCGQYSSAGLPLTGYIYDAMGRYTETYICNGSNCNGTQTNYFYTANDVAIYTGLGQTFVKQLEYDALGRVASVCEVSSSLPGVHDCGQNTHLTGYPTTYQQDPEGNLTSVTQGGQTRSFTYDLVGRMLSETNPENGTTHYTYDSDATCGTSTGDKVKRVDAAGNTTCYVWDHLHRLTLVEYPSGPNTANMSTKEFDYDYSTPYGISVNNYLGKLTDAYTHVGTTYYSEEAYSYDANGNETDLYEYTHNGGPGAWYHVQESYFPNGAMASLRGFTGTGVSTPFSNLLTFSLDGEGRLYSVGGVSPSITYNAASQPLSVVQYAGGSENFQYDSYAGRMTQWQSTAGSQHQTGMLTWNANGTLQQLQIADDFNSANRQICTNTYDDLARLISNYCSGTPGWTQNFSYDQYGNITIPNGSATFPATYSQTTNHVSNLGFSYDADGNVLRDNASNTFAYDAEGRQIQVNATSTIFDASNRAVELDSPSGRTQIIYAPNGAKFAYMSGQTLQKYIVPIVAGMQVVHNGDGTRYFVHTDWLGSSRLAVTDAGTVRYDRAYAPFGQAYAELSGNTTNRSFTGQTEDTASGIYDFQQREQSANQGRWFVPDPSGLTAVDITNPQSLNRYAYVGNNPLSNVDPLGLYLDDDDDGGDDFGGGGGGGGGGGYGCAYDACVVAPPPADVPTENVPLPTSIPDDSGDGSTGISLNPADNTGVTDIPLPHNPDDDAPDVGTPKNPASPAQNQPSTVPTCSFEYDGGGLVGTCSGGKFPVFTVLGPSGQTPTKPASKPKPKSAPMCTQGFNFFCELFKGGPEAPEWNPEFDDPYGDGAFPPLQVPDQN